MTAGEIVFIGVLMVSGGTVVLIHRAALFRTIVVLLRVMPGIPFRHAVARNGGPGGTPLVGLGVIGIGLVSLPQAILRITDAVESRNGTIPAPPVFVAIVAAGMGLIVLRHRAAAWLAQRGAAEGLETPGACGASCIILGLGVSGLATWGFVSA